MQITSDMIRIGFIYYVPFVDNIIKVEITEDPVEVNLSPKPSKQAHCKVSWVHPSDMPILFIPYSSLFKHHYIWLDNIDSSAVPMVTTLEEAESHITDENLILYKARGKLE